MDSTDASDDTDAHVDESLGTKGDARRRFLLRSGALGGGLAAAPYATAAPVLARDSPAVAAKPAGATSRVHLRVNDRDYELGLDPRVTLLDALREYLGMTGTKKGCDRGQCGACTVLVNGRRVNACLTLAMSCEGQAVTTIEGLAADGALHPVQQAFIEHEGFQCGYCTPGQICSAVAMLREVRAGDASHVTRDLAPTATIEFSEEELRERMSGNLCRCGAYVGIIGALRQVVARTT